jgi:hypothetical protein
MKRILPALVLFGVLALIPAAGRADEPPRCTASPDGDNVAIGCNNVSEAMGNRIAELLGRMLNSRIDPHMVLAALGDIEPLPPEGVARALNSTQEQSILNILAGKPSQQIAIIAHPQVADIRRWRTAPTMPAAWRSRC